MKLKRLDTSSGAVCNADYDIRQQRPQGDLYIGPPWIDFHCHVYHGVTSFGLRPDDIGFKAGVHLLVDAGSAGEETFAGFRDYVMPRYRTRIIAFLNISSIGLVTMREYYDRRNLNPEKAAACVRANRSLIAGIKARSSAIILEGAGTEPLKAAVEAAGLADCPVMVHLGEAPPDNEDNLRLLRENDIISHCFHGKGVPLWSSEGKAIPALEKALKRGVALDVAHGAASCDVSVAGKAIKAGTRGFSISTDLHSRCVGGPVYSLSATMTKFLSLGMSLFEVISAVSDIPAARLGFEGWGENLERNSTIFRLRERKDTDPPFIDSAKNTFPVEKVIEPVAVIMDGEYIEI